MFMARRAKLITKSIHPKEKVIVVVMLVLTVVDPLWFIIPADAIKLQSIENANVAAADFTRLLVL